MTRPQRRTDAEREAIIRRYVAEGNAETTDEHGLPTLKWRRTIAKELHLRARVVGDVMRRILIEQEIEELR
jgi:hypothetical protein